MKVAVLLALFASLAVGGVFGDEKSDAIKEIKKKYDELFQFSHTVVKHVQAEIGKRDPLMVNQTIEFGEKLKKNTLEQFANEVKKVSKTALVRGRHLSTFECLAKTSTEGRDQILKTHKEYVDSVENVVGERASRMGNQLISGGLILNAVTELKDEAIQNIQDAKSGVQSLKDDVLKKIENGKKQFDYLESSVPILREEYITVRRAFESKYKEINEILFRRLQKCLISYCSLC